VVKRVEVAAFDTSPAEIASISVVDGNVLALGPETFAA
jgi:hypothetical protein